MYGVRSHGARFARVGATTLVAKAEFLMRAGNAAVALVLICCRTLRKDIYVNSDLASRPVKELKTLVRHELSEHRAQE